MGLPLWAGVWEPPVEQDPLDWQGLGEGPHPQNHLKDASPAEAYDLVLPEEKEKGETGKEGRERPGRKEGGERGKGREAGSIHS